MEHRDVLEALNVAYPARALHAAGVDFDRGGDLLPLEEIDSDGRLFVTLRSLDWDTRKRVLIGQPMTEMLKEVYPFPYATGDQIVDAFDAAIAELREAPPFYLGG